MPSPNKETFLCSSPLQAAGLFGTFPHHQLLSTTQLGLGTLEQQQANRWLLAKFTGAMSRWSVQPPQLFATSQAGHDPQLFLHAVALAPTDLCTLASVLAARLLP